MWAVRFRSRYWSTPSFARATPGRIIGDGVDHQFLAYARWKKEDAGLTVSREDEQEAVRNGRMLMLAGDPRTLVSGLGPWIDVLLPRCPLNLVVKMHYPGVGESRTIEALELFAKEVMPQLKASRVEWCGTWHPTYMRRTEP